MLFNTDSDYKLFHQLSELNEKFIKSEAERNILEAKFRHLQETYRNEEGQKLALLKDKYNEFLENCKERNQRNEGILKSLQRVESGANAVFAKTERLKQLRSHYDAYLSRAMPLWRHPDALEDTGVPTTWIREPRMVSPCAHPAMLLPGGGAVMLPIQTNVLPQGYSQSSLIPRQVESQIIDTKRLPNSSAKVIATLGKAGEIMMQELGMLENNSLNLAQQPAPLTNTPQLQPGPLFYQPYQLPIYIPPAPTYYTNSTFNRHFEPSMQSVPLQVPTYSEQPRKEYISPRTKDTSDPNQRSYYKSANHTSSDGDKVTKSYKTQNLVSNSPTLDYNKNGNLYDRRKLTKDNYEIECLEAENNPYDDDLNLSDDDVLDTAKARPQSSQHLVRNKQVTSINRNGGINSTPNIHSSAEPLDYHGVKSKSLDNSRHASKKVEVAHQKSIDELKAMLSVENDESFPINYMPIDRDMEILVDEDVPDDFNEQNFPENHYDQRYQNNISRNVILEEDEDEEDCVPATSRRDDWQPNQIEQVQRSVTDNYSVLDVRRNEQSVKDNYVTNNVAEGNRNQNRNAQVPSEPKIQQRNGVSRPASAGKRSPSPVQNNHGDQNSKAGTYNRIIENNQFTVPGNSSQNYQMHYEEMQGPIEANNVKSYSNIRSIEEESTIPRDQLSYQPVSPEQPHNNYEAQQYNNQYNEYYSSDPPSDRNLPNVNNTYEDPFENEQYPRSSDVHGYNEHITEEQHPDDYSQNYVQSSQLPNEDHSLQYLGNESDPFVPPQEVASREKHAEYPDQYIGSHYEGYTQESNYETNGPQYDQNKGEYYGPHEGIIEEPYNLQSHTELNRNHYEPYPENSNEQYQGTPYVAEVYEEQPVGHIADDVNPHLEQTGNEYGTLAEVTPTESQQDDVNGSYQQRPVFDQSINEESGVINLAPLQQQQLPRIEETADPHQLSAQKPSNVDATQPLQHVEEKPRSSPQKQPQQRSVLQRRQSGLSQQSPQRQKQSQKGAQLKSQQRQSPKKSERTQQNSPKKPQTPEPQLPPSVMTQLIDSESESYQLEPSGQNPDDSDFDFSIGK